MAGVAFKRAVLASFRDGMAANMNVTEPAGFTKVSALGVEEQRVNVIIEVEIIRGLSAGDAVVLYLPDTLSDGSRVELR